MKYTIRSAVSQDLDSMLEWRGHTEAIQVSLRSEFAEYAQGKSNIWIAFDLHKNQVGTVQLVYSHRDLDLADNRSAYIKALEVHNDHRGCGIGTMLVKEIELHAKSSGLSRLTLMVEPNNLSALALYVKLGFQGFKESVDIWDGRTYPVVCLEKHLDDNAARIEGIF